MGKTIVFCCTNRPDSYTGKVSKLYAEILKNNGIDTEIFSFEHLPKDILFSETFGNRTSAFEAIIDSKIRLYNRFIFVVPEYNGSFPGILKGFLDSVHPREWTNKKACLVGVSSGRAGNLRGMEHLTGVLQYLKMHVFYNKLPISQIDKLLDETGKFIYPEQQRACELQVQGFLNQ